MADVIRKFGVQFVLENTKSVLNDADKFIAQMEKKTEKIDLTSEIKTEFEKLSDYLKNNFKNGLSLSSQFSNIINSKDVDEAINKIEDLSDSLKLVNTILNYDGGVDESFKKMLGELNSQQLADVFQAARNQKPRATHKTKQTNLLKTISDTYALGLKDKGSLGQTTEMSKELEGVLKNIGEDIKSIRQTVNGFEQKGIKSTLAGITAEMTQQGEAGQALNDVFVGLVNALGEYQKQGRKGLNMPENRSGETDVPKTPKEVEDDDPVTKELKKYGELDKTLASIADEHTFLDNFKSQAKDITSAIDKLKSMKISLEDIQEVYPRLVQGYRMWVAVQNQDSKNKIKGLYEQKLEQEKMFYRNSKEVDEGLLKSTDVKQSQEEYQAKSASFDNQINEEFANAIKQGILTQEEVDRTKLEYTRKLKEATEAIDKEVKEKAINSRLSEEEKEKRRKQEEERQRIAAETKREAEKEKLREEKQQQVVSKKQEKEQVQNTGNDLKLNRLKEMVSKENELFNKKDLKDYQEYMNSIREESLQLQKELSELNILPNDRQTNTFLKSQGNREAIVIDSALKAKQKEIEKVKNNPEEFKKQYQEASEFILEAQKRLEELAANGSKIASNKIKDNELFLNKENYFKKMIPNPNQEEIDYSIKELKKLEKELRTPIKGEFDPDKRTDYEQAYKNRIELIKEYREQLKQLGATEEEMSVLKGNALDKDYWIDILRQRREARRKEKVEENKEDELDTIQAGNDLAKDISGYDRGASRAVEDENIRGQSKYGDEISELSEEAEKIEQLTNIIKEYRSQMDETADIAQKIQIYNELQSKIEEIKTEYQELYATMQENDEDMTQILSWNDIESNYVPKKQEIENLKQQLEDSKKIPASETDTSNIDAQTDAISKNTETKEKSNEVSNNTDNSTENSQRQEATNIINQETDALNKNTEASEKNQQTKKKSNIVITTGNSQFQPNSFTMPDDTVVTTGNNEQITNSAEIIKEDIGKAVTKSNAKYEVDVTDIIKIKTDGLKGIALKIATDLNTAMGKYSKLTGLVPINEEAVAEVEEYKIAQEQIKNFPNIVKDMKFNNIFAKDKKGNLIKDGKIRKISFDSLNQMPKAQQQMIFEDKIISLYDEALNLSERINNDKGNKAQIEKAKERLSVLKEQMVALLSMFTEIGSMFSHQEIVGDKTVSIYVDPLEHLKNKFSDKTRRTHMDITDEEMTSFVKDFTQWLQPFVEEKNAIWDVGNNIKTEGKKIVDKNGRPIKVFDANARSNYNQARNLGETIQKYFDNSSMFNKNGNLQLTFEELQQISNLLPKSPKDNKYLKESVNPQEVFTKIQQIIVNAIQRNIDALSAQLENGEDVELPLKASRTALAQLYKSMGISIEKPKPVVAPVTQPVSTSQQPPSAPTVQQPIDNVGQIASETSKRLIEEGENAKVVGINFQDAALAKQAFTEANKEAKVSAEETAVAIAEETNEAEQVANEFDLVAEKTKEAVTKITSGNQKSLTPIEVLRNSVNLAEQIERVTNGKLPSAQGLGERFYKSQSEKYHRTIDEMDFNNILTLSSSLEVQTDSLLKLLSQVGVIGSDGFNQLATSMKVVEQAIVSTDNEVNTLYKTFNNTKIKGISKLSETQLMDKADNSLLEMERLYNENKQETNEYLLEQLKVKQVLDEMIKRSGGRSGLGVDNDFDAYKSILNNWIENNGLVSGKKGANLFSHDIKNIGDETGKAYGAKKAIEKWVRPMDYEDVVLISQQFGIILDYINQNQEALKLVHDQLQANLPIIEETADEMKEVTENAEQAAEAVDKVVNKTETPVQEEIKPSPVVTTDNSQKTNNKFAQLSDKEILDKYKKNQEYEDALKYFYTEEEILSGRASSHKADYIKLKEENAELEKIIKERGLLNKELKEEITETKEIIKEDTASQDKTPVEKEKPKNPTEEKWEKVKKKFGIETPDYSKLSDKEILAEYGKMSGKMNAQKRFINEKNKGIDVSQMTDEQLLSDSVEILGKEVFIGFRKNTEELKRLIEERKITIEKQKQVIEETKEQLEKDKETASSSASPSSINVTSIVHPVDVMPVLNIEDFSKKTNDEIKALSEKKKNELADVVHLNLAQRIDLSSMTDEEILANPNIKNKNTYFQLREENKELDRIIKERKSLEEEKKKVDAEINQPQEKDKSQTVQEKPIEEKPSPLQQETPAIEQHTEALDKASESANHLEQNLNDVAESLGEIEKKEEQLGQIVTEAEISTQPLSPEQTVSTTSELEETKNKVVELERQIANLQNQAQKFDFGDKAIETLKEFEKILKTISESLKGIDAKWKGIYATNASDFKKAIAEESQKSDIKSNNPTKTTNDIIKDQLKSDLIALTNKSSKTGIYGRDSLHVKDRANKLSDPKDIDNLEKADALFDKIARRIQNLKKSKSLSSILDDPEIKTLLEERKNQIDYVRRSKLRKNTNEDILNQNKNALKLEQAYKSATELAPEAYRIEDLIVNGTASDKDFKKFNDFIRAKNYIESEEGQKTQSLINPDIIKNYETAISFSEQRQEALRKEREELEKKAEAEKRAQEYESLKNRMDKAELNDEWDAKRSIENYKQQRKKEDVKRTTDLWTRMNKAEADDELDAKESIERYKLQRKKEDEARTKELWARMDAEEEYENQSYKRSQENYKKQLEYSKKVQQEEKNKIKNEQTKEAQSVKDGQDLIKVYEQLYNSYYKYQQLKNKQNDGVLSSAELKQVQDLETELDKLNAKLLEFANSKPELWNQKNVVDAEEAFKNNILNIDSIGNGDKVKQVVNAYDKRFSAEDKIRSLTVQQASNYNANRAKQIADLEVKVKEYTQIINENTKAIMDNNDAVALNIVNSAKQQYNQKTESSTNVLNESINTDRINKAKSTLASLEELRSEYSSGDYTNQQELLDAVETRINNINQLIKDLNINPLDLTTEEDLDALTQIDKELENYKKDIADIKKDSKDYQTANGSKTARSIAEFMAKNSGISQEAKDALQQYINLIDKGVNVGQLREIGAAFEDIKRQEIEAGRTGTTFFDMLGQRVKGLTATLMTYVSFWRIFSELKQGFQIIHQFDDALAEMQKVSNETLNTLKEFQGTSFDLADSIGSDALALQQSVAEFMRLGQSLEEATDSAKSANILLNVSEFTSASEASEALIAMSQAYQDLSNIEIIDVINKLGNDFPISTQGLATALQDGAASLTTAGNSFYEAAALVTAGNRITQDPSKVGKAMRTIALRLTGTEASKAELEEDGEEVEGMITNVSKLRDVIMQATKVGSNNFKGFDILKDNGAYKSTYEILLGIADIYDEIVENDEKYGTKGANLLLETIAGKNRASIAASILQSPQMLKDAYAEAIDAEGSAEIENAKYIDSISGHLEKLKNAWQEVWANTLNRDVINFFLDLGTAILKVVSSIGLLPTIGILGGSIATLYEFAKGDGLIVKGLETLNAVLSGNTNIVKENTAEIEKNALAQKEKSAVTTEDTAVNEAHGVSELTATELLDAETQANIENVASQTAEMTADEGDIAVTTQQAATTMANVAATKQETASNLENAASEQLGNISKDTSKTGGIISNLTSKFSMLGDTLKKVIKFLFTTKAGLTGLALTAGAIITTKAIDVLNIDASNTAKEAKEIISAFQESQANIKEHKQTIDELSASYVELSKGVNIATNSNLTLSDEEYQQYLNTCNQIADLYPELVTGYDLQGNAILNLKDNVDALTESLIKEQIAAADTLIHGGLAEDQRTPWQRFLHWGDDNSIQKTYQNNYENYEAFQEVRDHFSNQSTTLDDYNKYRQELIDRSSQGDSYAGQLLHQLYLLADSKIVTNNEELEQLLKNIAEQTNPEGFNEAQKNAKTLVKANLSLDETYQDLMYRGDTETQKNASNLFSNIINSISPEQLNNLMSNSEDLKDVASNISQIVNNLLTDTSNNQINWSKILNTKDLNNAIDGYQDSFDKLHKLGYTDQAIFSMADMGKVGNVNLNTDRAIQWNEDNLNKYISQLRGWNEGLSDEEIKKKFKNEVSTVFGSGETFDFGKGTIDLSFATITEDGRLLDIEEIYDYIQTILSQAEESGEPLTIDTVLKFDAQGITDKNGNTIKNMIAGEGFNASEAMHEIELLKGYGDTTGFIDILHQYKNEYGSFITDILQMSGDARNGLQKITNFQDILKDIDNYNVGEGILANANMGDFTKLTALYKKSFAEAFADSGINGEDLFNSMFTDKSVLELNDRFTEVLQTSSVTAMNREAREQAKELFSTLSQDEADAFLQAFNGAKNFEEVLNNYHNNLRALASGAYEAVVNIEDATAAVSTLTSALSSSASGNGLSEEEIGNIKTLFQDVVDFDENKLLENTANGVHLNVEELERLNKEYADFNIKKQSKRLDYYNEKLEESSKELDRLNKEWANAKDDDTKQRYADLYKGEQTVRQGIEDNISALQREIAQYASLTSAYNQYVQAQSSANENARYENIGSGYETTKDLIERGWIGQDDVRAYLNMFTQNDMMTASSEELYAVWNKIDDKINSAGYSLKDFFTYDENGKSTSDGIFNFLDTVKQAAKDSGQYSEETLNKLVSKDKEGNYSFDFDIIGGDNKIADLLGVDLSLIQAIIQAARDAGFEVQMTEALPGLESLTDKIRNARDRLKELGLSAKEIDKYKVDLSLDFSNAENYESATKTLLDSIDEIKNSDMSPEVKDASLDYVNGQLDAIIAKKAILSLPTALSYDTSEVETGFQSLYASMQNYWLLQNELTQRKTLGLDTSKNEADLKAMTKDIFGLLKAMDETDREELGFGDIDFTADTEKILSQIEEKLKEEDLELHIPTTLEDPNGDPTKGIDSQKVTIDIQFSVDGKTLVLKDITSVQQAADNLDGTNANVDATANTAQAEEGLAGVAEEKHKAEGSFEVEAKGKNIGTLQSAIKNARAEARDKSFTITALSSGFSGIIDFFKNIYNKITNKSVTITTNYATTGGGGNVGGGKRAVPLNGSGYNGTAHALGTAYARGTSGNWGVPEDQDALTGELGEELVVRNGRFFTVGSESAEMVHLQKGDIVFNADQTKQIFEKGRIINGSRRGKAHADGTAYSAGSGGRRRTNAVVANSKTSNNSSSNNNNNKSNNKKSSSNNNNNNEAEKMDWIAIAIERIEQQIDELNDVVDSVYRSWSDRNKALTKEIKAVSDEIAIQQAGYKRYLKEAESVGLSEAYAKKVREGTIDIQKITDEKLKKKIDEYQQWYKAAEDCRVKIAELEETENELYQQKIDNIITRYEAISNKYQDQISSINALMDLAEEQGLNSSSKYYKALQDWEEKNLKALITERQKAFEQLQDNISEGMIIRGSEQWLETVSNIDQITESIINSQKALVEYNNEIRKINWDNFDLGQERIEKVTDEAQFMIDTLSNEELFDEKGTYTAQGLASQALHISNLEAYTKQSEQYAEAIEEARDAIAKDPYNQELIDRYYELIEAQQDAINNIYSEKDAIKDLIEQGIDKELESLQKLIDKYKDAISSQSDLLSYQDNVTDQAEEVAKIQKQIAAYSGDNSEESRLKVQQLQQSLKDAQKALSDTQREHNESDITESLDSLYEQYEELLNEKLKDTDALISDVVERVNANGSDIRNAILESANKVDYTLTEALNNIVSIADGSTIATKVGQTIAGILQNVISTDNNSNTNAKNKLNETPLGIEDYGWQTDKNGNMQYREFGASDVVKNGMHEINGKNYYFDENGNVATGFIKNGGKTYYFNEETRQMGSGLTEVEGEKYYFDPNTKEMQTGNVTINGKDYYFSQKTGKQLYGLRDVDGNKYYYDSKSGGAKTSGWQTIDGQKYYFDPNTNQMVHGLQTIDKKKYYFDEDGKAIKGFKDIDGFTYYFKQSDNSALTSNWLDYKASNGKIYRYRLNKSSHVVKNKKSTIGGNTYYFDEEGRILTKKNGSPKTYAKKQYNYSTGVYKVGSNREAWTQEYGKTEAIIRPTDGAILTPIIKNDSILDPIATKNMFAFFNNPTDLFKQFTDGSNYESIPNSITNNTVGDISVTFNIAGSNITDFQTFMTECKNSPQFEKMVRAMTVDRMFGGSALKKFKV